MLVLAKAILALMIGFFTSIIFGLVIIPILRKSKVKQSVSVFLKDKHKEKEGTPTMGGLIFIIPTLLTVFILLMLNKIEFSENLFIILFVFGCKENAFFSNSSRKCEIPLKLTIAKPFGCYGKYFLKILMAFKIVNFKGISRKQLV